MLLLLKRSKVAVILHFVYSNIKTVPRFDFGGFVALYFLNHILSNKFVFSFTLGKAVKSWALTISRFRTSRWCTYHTLQYSSVKSVLIIFWVILASSVSSGKWNSTHQAFLCLQEFPIKSFPAHCTIDQL